MTELCICGHRKNLHVNGAGACWETTVTTPFGATETDPCRCQTFQLSEETDP